MPTKTESATASALAPLDRLVGRWTTTASHPLMPGVVVHGTVVAEWLEGKRFLIHRATTDHPDFPDSISIIGFMERDRVGETPNTKDVRAEGTRLEMHYFDSRGVSRIYEVSFEDGGWRLARHAPGFSQRYTGKYADNGNTIVGRWEASEDDRKWEDDLEITYRRAANE